MEIGGNNSTRGKDVVVGTDVLVHAGVSAKDTGGG